MPATLTQERQKVSGKKRVLAVMDAATTDLKLGDIALAAELSVRVTVDYLRQLRGEGKVTRFRGGDHDVFYKRVRR